MQDKNGKEIKTGDIVRISGAYFKGDNALYFVRRKPGDPHWYGADDSLSIYRIGKNGKLLARGTQFWPLSVTVSSRQKRLEAIAWNREHATIEIIEGIPLQYIAAEFQREAEEYKQEAEFYSARGLGAKEAEESMRAYNFYKKLGDRLAEESGKGR